MKIGITTFGGDSGRSGIGEYLTYLLSELARLEGDDEFEVIVSERDRDVFVRDAPRLRQLVIPDWLHPPLVNIIWHQVGLGALCWRRGYDVLLLGAANRRIPWWVPCPVVGVVHDLASVYVADKYDLFHQIYIRKVVPTLLRRLDGVVTISENTRQDVIEHVPLPPKRVHAVRCGVDHGRFAPGLEGPAREEVLSRHGLSGPYVIYVSRIEHPGKNHVRLIEAFDRLKRRHPGLPHSLLLVGGDRERAEEVHQAAERVSTASSIRFSGFIDRADLRALYEGAALAITPSLFEGFGLPVLEAMACGTAVACSRTSALPEVAGGAAALFDPYDVESIASVLERVLLDDALREDLRRRGLERSAAFTWQGCAQRTLEVVKGFAR